MAEYSLEIEPSGGLTIVLTPEGAPSKLRQGGPSPTSRTLESLHKLSYYEAMPMTSLNISLPEPLKQYVERQVASGDWGTPSEYVRDLIRQDKERRLSNLEQDLVVAARGPKTELPIAEIRRKGLIPALRERARKQ